MKKYLLIFVGIIVGVCLVGKSWGQTATYTISSTTAVTTTGTAPSGATASYAQTYNTVGQMTSGNSTTLTLNGYAGYKITSIVLSMKSNSSKGAGTLSVVAGSTTIASVSPTAKFNTASWYGAWSTSYVYVTKTPTDYEIGTGENVVITIAATENSLYIEKYIITYESAAASGPTITLTPTSLTGFTYVAGSGPSAVQTFTVEGSNLTNDISIAAPTNYEISKTSGSGYATSLTFTQSGGTVASTTVYVRLKAGLSVGDYNSETITASSTGAANKTVICSGTVTCPSVSAPTANAGTSITGTSFSANWGAVSGATGYELDVYQTGGTPVVLIDEDFESGEPTGWTNNSAYFNAGDAYNSGNKAGMNAVGDWIRTTAIDEPSTLNFWHRPSSAGSNPYTITIQTSTNGTDWTDITTVSHENSATYTEETIDLGTTSSGTYIRFYMSQKDKSFYFDDVEIISGGGTTYTLQNEDVGNVTSYSVTGLTTDETYYYVVRAYNDCGNESANSNEIEVTTVGSPGITVSPTTLTGFTYVEGLGPSSNKTFTISGSNLTGSGNITVTGSTNYEVSTDGTTFAASVTYPFASGVITGQPKTVYVRLKAGLSAATYNENISYAGGGVTSTNFTCSGIVTAPPSPTITLSETTLTGFTYVEGSGPSSEQTFTVSGSNLTNDISIAAPTNYEISKTSGSGYATPLTFTPSSGTVTATTVYVRLKAGLSVGTYDSENISATSTGATNKTVSCSGTVTATAVAGACATDLIISEYVEGSSNNKYIEIYNGTGASVNLSNYEIRLFTNGSSTASNTETLTGTLAANAALVFKNSSASVYTGTATSSPICLFNGNDAIALYKISTSSYVDIFGTIGENPGSAWTSGSFTTLNRTLVRNSDVVNGITTNPSSGFPTLATEWTQYNEDNVSNLGSHTMICGPTITVVPATLTGFTYIFANGPSAEQTFTVVGTNLTANISLTPPTNYEISTTTGGSFAATNPITLTQSGGNVALTTIYVRLKAGLAAGNYNLEDITATSTDAADKTVTCSGIVTGPTLTVSTTALTGFDYIFGNGPSTSQSFTVSGTYLTTDLVVTAPTDYEVSTVADSGYGASVSLTPASNTVATTTIYVRLESGKAIGTYNLQNIVISSTGATSENLACSGKVTLAPATNLAVGCTGNASAVITWTAPVGTSDGVVIAFRDDDNNVPHTISDGTNPAIVNADAIFGGGYEFGTTTLHSFVVYKGTGTTVTVTGLTAGETYKVKAYTFSGTNWIDNTDCPTVTVSNLGLNEVTLANNTDSDSQSELIWTNPATCVDEILVVCKHGSAVSANPTGNGNAYSANSTFGSGTEIVSGEFVVFKGTGAAVTVTGLTNDETYYAKIFTRKGTEWSTGVELILYPASVTILEYGDLAIVAVNTGQAGGDEISFVSFKSIATNTSIDFTDNGYERATAGKWGDSEGTIRITRTGSNVPAGSVITIVGDDGGATPALGTDFNIYLDGSVDNTNWTLASLNGSSPFNMNSTDQVWIMQGGNWTNGGGSQDGEYSGNVLYGWTAIGWETAPGYNDTKGSTIYPGCECATTNVLGKVDEDKVKYTGATTAANRTEWIGRINDPSNWTDYSTNPLFDEGSPAYRDDGATFTITAGALTVGKWAGYKSSEWCDCANWWSLKVPDASIDVEIPVVITPQFELILEDDVECAAECNSLNILGSVTNNTGAILKVYDDFVLNTGSVDFSVNTIDIEIGGDIIIDDASNFLTSKVNLSMNGTTSQTFNVEDATLETIQLNSLKLTTGGTKTTEDNLVVTGDLIIANPVTFNPSGKSVTIGGNFSNTNATDGFTEAGSTVIFNGTSGQTISSTATMVFNDLTISNSSVAGVGLGGNITVSGLLDLGSDGNFKLGSTARTITLSNTVASSLGLAGSGTANIDLAGAAHLFIIGAESPSYTGNIDGGTSSTVRYNRNGNQTILSGAKVDYFNLSLLTGGTKTTNDDLVVEGDLLVDASIFSTGVVGKVLLLDKNLTLQNSAEMHNNCLSNLDIWLMSGVNQTLRGNGYGIKTHELLIDKNNSNISLSSTGGSTNLFIGSLGDFNMTGTSVFTDNANIIQTDDDLYLGGDGSSNYSLTGIVRFTGANVTGNMILSDDDGSSVIAAELYTLEVTGGDLEVYPTTGGQTIIVNNDFSIKGTSTASANSNDFEIGGDYYVNADAAFDAHNIIDTMNGTTDQVIDANSSQETFAALIIDKPSGNVNLSDNIDVDDLSLTSGLINTSTNRVFVTNPLVANISGHNSASYINGNLRRAVYASGSYDMPVGTSSNYELLNINLNSSTGLTYIDASFNPSIGNTEISSLNLMVDGTLLQELLNGGFWTITPNAGLNAVSYDAGLTLTGSTNAAGADAGQHTVVKRINSSADWTLQGTHTNATQIISAGSVYAKRSSFTEFSDFAIAKHKTNILPVELLSFTAKCNNGITELAWETASEINNDYFEVQKSDNGYSWNNIGVVKGAGNSSIFNSYAFAEKGNSATTYYRLRQVDYDGKFEYSPIIVGNCDGNEITELIIYPNPATDILNISIGNWKAEKISWEIVNVTGQTVLNGEIYANDSFASEQINISSVNPGMYLIRFSDNNNKMFVRKIDKK